MIIDIQEYQNIRSIDGAIEKLFSCLLDEKTFLQKAVDFAKKSHHGQTRKSGEPYVVHPILVSSMVASLTGDLDMSIAALLHDVVEDTNCSLEDISKDFGENISSMVDGLTKIDNLKKTHISCAQDNEYIDQDSGFIQSAVNLRKIFFQESHNEKVFIIKLCDRLHNLSTLDALSSEKQKKIAQESLIIYAPIAHRLGISSIKNSIEDISFMYTQPNMYASISQYLKDSVKINNTNEFLEIIRENLYKRGFSDTDFKIMSRIKHKYSIYMKMQREGIPASEVLDIIAIRIITSTRLDCYKVLGIVHEDFKPINSKLKDYIALPKENGYQTLHTTVLSGNGAYEIQIRTEDMHQSAENGIAAHWKYKGLDTISPNLNWFNNLEYKNSEIGEFKDLVLYDLYTESVEVFSPQHEVFSLPRGSVVLDFAYAVHGDVGNYAQKAYINNLEVSLLQEVHSGDIIYIQKSDKILYHCSWIDMVQTSKAKKHIKHLCAQRLKQKNINNSYNILCTFFDKNRNEIENIVDKYDDIKLNIEQVSYDVSFLKNAISIISNELPYKNIFLFSNKKMLSQLNQTVVNHFLVYHRQSIKDSSTSYCCNVKMGDNIVGFLRGQEVVIHHKMCNVASEMIENNTPSVFVQWDSARLKQYSLFFSLDDKVGTLSKFLTFLARMKINVSFVKLNKKYRNNYKRYCHIKFSSRMRLEDIENRITKKGYSIVSLKEKQYQENTY